MSAQTEKPASYDRVAIAFHWVIALLVVGLAAVGLRLESIPRPDQLT